MRSLLRPALACFGTATLIGACIAVPEGQGIPKKITEQDDGGPGTILVDASAAPQDARGDLVVSQPHMVIGVDPPHGPFSGGQRALVRGNGFAPDARVWFGPAEVPAADVLRIDATRLQVAVPPGGPGSVAVTVRNGEDESTSRTLEDAYAYDAWFASPSSGPTSGGTIVSLQGKGTSWVDGTTVRFGGVECQSTQVLSATSIQCTTPAHAPGTVSIAIRLPGEESAQVVDDAFVFADSDNGFKGGLSGLPLKGTMQVAAFNNYTGDPVSGATVILGDSLGSALQKKTDAAGIAVFNDTALAGNRSVTIAKTCYEPQTFVDVPVDTVTAYLNPIMSPDCGADGGDIPPVGGKGSSAGVVKGQLVWYGGNEFKRAPWNNVPSPKSDKEKLVAYVFVPASEPTSQFYLPDQSSAVTPDADGTIGYSFAFAAYPGNITLYALAGLEDRSVSPAAFTPYAMGLIRGISTLPGEATEDVFIPMTKVLDQAMSVSITPPLPGPKGPDRVIASLSVQLGSEGYALFPNSNRSVPIADQVPMQFVGLPGLDGVLAGSVFVASATAATGSNKGPPMSVVGSHVTNDASQQVSIDGFVQVPVIESPMPGTQFDGKHISFKTAPGATSVDVSVIKITAGAGLVEWVVSVPPGKTSVELPDLASLGLGLMPGPVDIAIYCAHVTPFDYGSLVYRQLGTRGWSAYAYDVFHVHY